MTEIDVNEVVACFAVGVAQPVGLPDSLLLGNLYDGMMAL